MAGTSRAARRRAAALQQQAWAQPRARRARWVARWPPRRPVASRRARWVACWRGRRARAPSSAARPSSGRFESAARGRGRWELGRSLRSTTPSCRSSRRSLRPTRFAAFISSLLCAGSDASGGALAQNPPVGSRQYCQDATPRASPGSASWRSARVRALWHHLRHVSVARAAAVGGEEAGLAKALSGCGRACRWFDAAPPLSRASPRAGSFPGELVLAFELLRRGSRWPAARSRERHERRRGQCVVVRYRASRYAVQATGKICAVMVQRPCASSARLARWSCCRGVCAARRYCLRFVYVLDSGAVIDRL